MKFRFLQVRQTCFFSYMQVDLTCCCSSARRRFYSKEVKGLAKKQTFCGFSLFFSGFSWKWKLAHANNVMSLFLFERKVAFAVAFRPLETLLKLCLSHCLLHCTVSTMRKFLRNTYCEFGKFWIVLSWNWLETEAEVSLYLNQNPETELVKCQGT